MKLSERNTGTPNASSLVHIVNDWPASPKSFKASLSEAVVVGDGIAGTLSGKSIDAATNSIRNVGFLEIGPNLIANAPDESTASDSMEILIYDPTTSSLKKISRLDWQTAITAAGENNTGENKGTGVGVYKGKITSVLEFRSLIADPGVIDIVENSENLTFTGGAQIVRKDQANIIADGQSISLDDSGLVIRVPASAFAYTFRSGTINVDVDITLPDLAANDIIVCEANVQTLSNKTISASNNTVSDIGDANIASHTSTKITIDDKGQLPGGGVYNDQNNQFGAFYLDIQESAEPAAPAAGFRRLFVDQSSGEWSLKTPGGSVVSMEVAGAHPVAGKILQVQLDLVDQTADFLVTELILPLEANSLYKLVGHVYMRALTASGQYGFKVPVDSDTKFFDRTATTFSVGNTGTIVVSPAANPKVVAFHGSIVTGATVGTLQMFIKSSSAPSTLRLDEGTAMFLTKEA